MLCCFQYKKLYAVRALKHRRVIIIIRNINKIHRPIYTIKVVGVLVHRQMALAVGDGVRRLYARRLHRAEGDVR